MQLQKRGTRIQSVEDWFRLAPPKMGKAQWKPGRSALELARTWCPEGGAPRLPEAFGRLLASHPGLGAITVSALEPECPLPFDDLAGEPRNADLAGLGQTSHGPIAITVEAKADELFGKLVQQELSAAVRTIASDGRTNMVTRIQQLAASLLPERLPDGPTLGQLRYQLLTATAGSIALAEANAAKLALLIVHEFRTSATHDAKLASNAQDLDRFLGRLASGTETQLESGRIVGPFSTPGHRNIAFYVGKLRTDLLGTGV